MASGLRCFACHSRVIDLADGDPAKGNFLFGSPLGARVRPAGYSPDGPWVGPDGETTCGAALPWRTAPTRLSYVTVVSYVYTAGIPAGALRPDDSAVREIEDALAIAERSGDNLQLGVRLADLGPRAGAPPHGCRT